MSTAETVAIINAAFSDNGNHNRNGYEGQGQGEGRGQGQLQSLASPSVLSPPPSDASADALMSCELLGLEGGGRGERVWTQVSGSGDVLTVLVSHTQADTSRGGWDVEATDREHIRHNVAHIEVRVSVTNTSGFKVPAFSVGLVLVPSEERSRGLPAVTIAPTLPSGKGTTLMGADGLVEYMLPGSALEKRFTLEVRRVCSFDAVVRLSYPDLAVEESDSGDAFFVCPITSPSVGSPSRSGGSRAGAVAAETDCAPVHIDFWTFCQPLRVGQGQGQGQRGLSAEEFAVLWDRLPYSISIPGKGMSNQHHLPLPSSSSADPYRVVSPPSSSSSSPYRLRAWVMKTLWGSTVALRVEEHTEEYGAGVDTEEELYSKGNSSSSNSGSSSYSKYGYDTSQSVRNGADEGTWVRVAVRCEDSGTLSAFVEDGIAVIDELL